MNLKIAATGGFVWLAAAFCDFFTPPAQAQQDSADRNLTEITAAAPEEKEERGVTLSVANAPLSRVAAQLSGTTEATVLPRGKTPEQRVTLIVRNQPLDDVIEQIASQIPAALVHRPADRSNVYEIWDRESYNQTILPTLVRMKVFVTNEIPAEDAFKAIEGVLTPGIGHASFDPRSNKVFVTDLPEVLQTAQTLISHIDVDFVTRVFYIRRNDVDAIAEKISRLQSPAAPPIEVDVRSHQIVVRDRLHVVRQMEKLIETIDDPDRTPLRARSLDPQRSSSEIIRPQEPGRRGRRL